MIANIRNFIYQIRDDERGLTAVEYAILGGLIAAGLTVVTTAFIPELRDAFTNILK